MEPIEKTTTFGPAIAIVIIVGIVSVGGILFYKHMITDLVQSSNNFYPRSLGETNNSIVEPSSSTDIIAIEQDANVTIEDTLDLSFLDEIDEQLLNFDELDSINFDI